MSEPGTKIVMFPGWPRKLHIAQRRWQDHYLECDECSLDRYCPQAKELLAVATRVARELSGPTLQKRRLR